MDKQVGRVLVDAECRGLLQFACAIAAAEEADAERAAARRRQHVPDAVADDNGGLDRRVEPRGGGEEKVRVGLGVFDLIARDDRPFVPGRRRAPQD